ncbi:hypothetical protein KC19_2G280500 [Ceratodon purpureus]|uniref:Uncharacterized protein n=1 Tax=Ceratodon purpureus TaxID=3225 RepID=A0A8T0J2L9_CERPU|nr:hypothetical protein KC19_2G280500 [Ceratodon purpureus]
MILNRILQLELLQPTHCHSRSDIVEALPLVLKSARSTTLSCTRILAGLDLIGPALVKINNTIYSCCYWTGMQRSAAPCSVVFFTDKCARWKPNRILQLELLRPTAISKVNSEEALSIMLNSAQSTTPSCSRNPRRPDLFEQYCRFDHENTIRNEKF